MSDHKQQIENYIIDFVRNKSHVDMNRITPETMIFLEGIFDSMGFILLIDFLENNFDIKANEDDLIEKNFESVKAITDFVVRKRNGFPHDLKNGITID